MVTWKMEEETFSVSGYLEDELYESPLFPVDKDQIDLLLVILFFSVYT